MIWYLNDDLLFDDNCINFYKEKGYLTYLSYNSISESVGIFYQDGKFYVYRTNERNRICVRKEFNLFDDALVCARRMYKDLKGIMQKTL
jgi:hypothetical protein